MYKFEGSNIVGIKPGTKVETFKSNIIGTGIQVFNQSGTELTTGQIVGTGMTMKSGSETYTFVGYDKAGNITIESIKIDV